MTEPRVHSLPFEPYRPVYVRPPNKLLRYETRPFVDRVGNRAMLRIAIFMTKGDKEQETVAQVMWEGL